MGVGGWFLGAPLHSFAVGTLGLFFFFLSSFTLAGLVAESQQSVSSLPYTLYSSLSANLLAQFPTWGGGTRPFFSKAPSHF